LYGDTMSYTNLGDCDTIGFFVAKFVKL
jgi:hypothetical protein